MSTFYSELVCCPHCGSQVLQNVAHSINAKRSPHYKQAILAGQFQRYPCSNCGQDYLVDKALIYFDDQDKIWIGMFSATQEYNWQQYEHEPMQAYQFACGATAPPIAQAIGQDMKIRTVFGLSALREKILCFQAGIDDTVLELLKFRLALSGDRFALEPRLRLRLLEINPPDVIFQVESPAAAIQTIAVDWQLYETLTQELELWAALRQKIESSPYRDMGKLLSSERWQVEVAAR
ncbi:MAG: CpXC domain-containing protein [Synechococcales bacterium]|nr:CpXC domain-containing protein [Synechococcales bacterium]